MANRLIILGSGGRLGSQLAYTGSSIGCRVECVTSGIHRSWLKANDIREWSAKAGLGPGDIVICASGITDPDRDQDAIAMANLVIPSMVCEQAVGRGAMAVTLGTILETAIPTETHNAYVRSKTLLSERAHGKWLHLRLHTVFGGREPTSHMFIGQMLAALREDRHFSMTGGTQLREYHHVEDDARAILHLASQFHAGELYISHGHPISLRSLAIAIFRHFGKESLLGVGDLPLPENETFKPVYARSRHLNGLSFRETIPAILAWLDEYV